MTRIGVQGTLLVDEIARSGIFETLRSVSKIGYHALEVAGMAMTPENVAELERARTELGMDIASISGSLAPAGSGGESLTTQFDKYVDDAQRLGATMIRVGMLPAEAMASTAMLLEFCDRSNDVAARLREHGIRLYYHNHHIDFTKYDGRYLLDVIAERAPLVGFEVDVHWVQRGGLDPVATLKKYGERVAMVHLKDYRIGRISASAFDELDAGDRTAFNAELATVVQFAEVGEGNLDFASIIPVSQQIGAQYLLVEQDEHYGRTPLECLQTSYDNIVALGYGHLF
ncbi:MAG TPA: sugar phosphate isomerase/epimerase [Microbacteriaceae bacterium]